MANSIESRDIQKVYALLLERLPEAYMLSRGGVLTMDNWAVLVGGWHHGEKWSRGFMVSDYLATGRSHRARGVSPAYDEGRYDGRGWHERMADDAAAQVKRLREEVETGLVSIRDSK